MGLYSTTGRSGSGINLSGSVTLDFIPFNIKTVYDETVQYYDTIKLIGTLEQTIHVDTTKLHVYSKIVWYCPFK